MRVVIRASPRVRPPEERGPAPQFELLPRRPSSFLPSLLASALLHGAVLEMSPGLLLRIEYWRFRPPELQKVMVRSTPLLVRVPEAVAEEKLYFRPPARLRQEAAARRPRGSARPATQAPQQAEAAPTPERPSALVLQPGRSAEPPKKLPPLKAMAVWSGPNPRLVEEPIVPGAREPGLEPSPAGRSAAMDAPVLAPPRLPASMSPAAAMEQARVYLPPSGSSPLSSRRQWLQEPEVAFSAANPGTPAAFIIVTPERPKPGETITVPPGNLVVLGSGAGQAAVADASAVADRPAAQASAKGPGGGGDVQVAKLDGKPSGTESRANGSANGTASPGSTEKTRAGAAANGAPGAGSEIAAAAGAAPANKSAAATRTIRTSTGDIFALVEGDGSVTLTYPAGGSFDVVVVDASLPQAIASHTSALSGSPVYTAYLNVGQPVEWILHYCLPGGEGGARRQHAVVTLSAPKPLKAPYVVEAHLPPEPLWRWNGYQVFHALLSASGRLERLRALQAGNAAEVLLDSLRRWTFRPALLDGAPAATEVLLVIPPFRP
jgi:hypothetical protein